MSEQIKRLKRELKFKGKIIDFYQDTMEINGDHTVIWDFIKHKGAAAVVPVTEDGRILMVRQYRNALDRYTLEIPEDIRRQILLFTAGMAAGRLTAPLILRRLRPERLIAACAVFAAIGIALAIFPEGHLAGALAVIFWGLGASLGFPLVISCAASGSAGSNTEHREEAGSRVSLVATVGYIDFLVSPPILGFLGQELGLRMAMLPVLGMVCMALVCALILGRLRAPQQA